MSTHPHPAELKAYQRAVGLPAPPTALRPELPAASPRLGQLARRCAMLIGDVAVIWVRRGGPLEPAACDARDPADRSRLTAMLRSGPRNAGQRWIDQVGERAAAVRVTTTTWETIGLASPVDKQPVSLLCLPLHGQSGLDGVVAIVRDSGRLPFSLRDSVTALRTVAGQSDASQSGPRFGYEPACERSAVCTTDLDGQVAHVTTAATEVLGVPAGALEGTPLKAHIPDVPDMLDGTFAVNAERCDRKLAGPGARWLDMTSEPLLDRAGHRVGTINCFTDITERRQAEARTRQRVPTRLPRRGGDQPQR